MESVNFKQLSNHAPHIIEELGYHVTVEHLHSGTYVMPVPGSCVMGYVTEKGHLELGPHISFPLYPGYYFCAPAPARFIGSGLMIGVRDYSPSFSLGGPIERSGRLRYIDGCTDSLLIPPMKKGDPCLNALFFPPGIDQTQHTHPSVRLGITLRGEGECIVPDADPIKLHPGKLWCIPTGGMHKFRTKDSSLAVLAFHPDSDVGPEDDYHQMLTRTLIEDVPAHDPSRAQYRTR